jgi:uncharacterized protein involved in exopolysaccharide biosynthesis
MADELTAALRKLVRRVRPAANSAPLAEPATAFEALLRQRVEALEREVADLRGRVFGLLFVVAGGVLAQVLARFLG